MSTGTLPGLLLERAKTTPNAPAIRFHDLGIWEEETWSSLADRVRAVGNGLAALGIVRGDVVALAARNHPSWIVADLAIQGLGAVTLALDPDFSPATVGFLLEANGAVAAITGDQEQYDKVADARSTLPRLRNVVVIDTRGIRHLDRQTALAEDDGHAAGTTWARIVNLGGSSGVSDAWTATAAALDEDEIVTVEVHVERDAHGGSVVRTTSATSRDLRDAANDLALRLGAHSGDDLYPIASFADPVERTLGEVLALHVGTVVNIGAGGALTRLESQQVQPTIAHIPAERLRAMRAEVEQRRARRGIRRIAVDRVLRDSGTVSRSSMLDLRVTQLLLAGLAVASVIVHRTLVDRSGLLRLGIIASLASTVAAILIGGGFAVRPFIRKTLGLSRAHSLLTSPDADTDTIRFLGALRLNPILERRSVASGSEASRPEGAADS